MEEPEGCRHGRGAEQERLEVGKLVPGNSDPVDVQVGLRFVGD